MNKTLLVAIVGTGVVVGGVGGLTYHHLSVEAPTKVQAQEGAAQQVTAYFDALANEEFYEACILTAPDGKAFGSCMGNVKLAYRGDRLDAIQDVSVDASQVTVSKDNTVVTVPASAVTFGGKKSDERDVHLEASYDVDNKIFLNGEFKPGNVFKKTSAEDVRYVITDMPQDVFIGR